MSDHMHDKLYGIQSAEDKSKSEEKQTNFDRMIFALFNTDDGKVFKESLEEYLTQPVWFVGEDKDMSLYREGARHYVMQLLQAYDRTEQHK